MNLHGLLSLKNICLRFQGRKFQAILSSLCDLIPLSFHELRQQSTDKLQNSWIYIVLCFILHFKIHRLRDLFAISYILLPLQGAAVTIMQDTAASLDFHTNNLLLMEFVHPPNSIRNCIKYLSLICAEYHQFNWF